MGRAAKETPDKFLYPVIGCDLWVLTPSGSMISSIFAESHSQLSEAAEYRHRFVFSSVSFSTRWSLCQIAGRDTERSINWNICRFVGAQFENWREFAMIVILRQVTLRRWSQISSFSSSTKTKCSSIASIDHRKSRSQSRREDHSSLRLHE